MKLITKDIPLAWLFAVGGLAVLTRPAAHAQAGLPMWTNRYAGETNGFIATVVGTDGSGRVFVSGVTGYLLATGYSPGYATRAYSEAGVPVWTNRFSGIGGSFPAMAVESGGNVIITGSSDACGGGRFHRHRGR